MPWGRGAIRLHSSANPASGETHQVPALKGKYRHHNKPKLSAVFVSQSYIS